MDTLVNQILGNKEAKVYLAALELGRASVAKIAKKAALPRSTTYLILNDLQEKGLVSQILKNNKMRIIAEPPEKLVAFLREQIEKFSDRQKILAKHLPELRALYNRHPQKPAVRFYEGLAGIKTVLEETLKASRILVLCSGYDKALEKKLATYLEGYFEKVDERKIKTFELLGAAPDLASYIQKYQSTLHKIKKLPLNHAVNGAIEQSDNGKGHIDKLIYQDKVSLISFEFLNATIIEHAPIVQFEKSLFWHLWRKF